MPNKKRIVVWFRQDLRLHDNEALHYALERCEEVIPVYVFDERLFFGKSRFGFPKTGKFRTKFILESVIDLRESFRARGGDLIIRFGKPEEEVFRVAKQVQANWVYCNRERTQEEIDVQNALEANLWTIGIEINYFRGKMLFYTQDLPFPVSHTPETFNSFRKEVERIVPIRKPFETPENVKPADIRISTGDMPTLRELNCENFEVDERSVLYFKGGETAGLQRLREYLWDKDLLKSYEDTRNGLIGGDYSSKLSAWLSQGCLSPKQVYYEVTLYEEQRIKNKSTYKLVYELLWRDYFRLLAKRHGNAIFKKGGIKRFLRKDLEDDFVKFKIWQEGRTGVPFIDANMKELNLTGFMSNRGRQNVASFLINDLKVNWQMGAEYFETLLVDYDPTSNWGNWNYIAGVGADPREDRYFNILTQAKKYDPQGSYVKLWLPELNEIPSQKIHQPGLLSEEEQKQVHVLLGADYPKSVVGKTHWTH